VERYATRCFVALFAEVRVDENDTTFNPPGARGIGEIGITGVAGVLAKRGVSRDGKARARSADHARQAALSG